MRKEEEARGGRQSMGMLGVAAVAVVEVVTTMRDGISPGRTKSSHLSCVIALGARFLN